MAELVRGLLDDLGLTGPAPTTFAELVVWIVTATISAALAAGAIKTFLLVCRYVGDGGTRL